MTTECSVLLGMEWEAQGTMGIPGCGDREGFLGVTIPALRPEGERPAAKPGLGSSGYGTLALEGC